MLYHFRCITLVLLSLLLLAACEPAAAPTEPDETNATSTDLGGRMLIIGSDATYPPMEFIDEETQQIVGFDVDLMNEIGQIINATIKFENFSDFDAILDALASGQFDLVVSSVSVTAERDELVDFSASYLRIGQAITVHEENTSITSAEDLVDAALVGVQDGTTGERAVLEAGVPEAQIKGYGTIDLAFQDLSHGALDAVVTDGPPSAQYTAQFDNLKVVGEPFTTEEYAIALQEGDSELQAALNMALGELKANGTLEELMETWNLQDVADVP